MYRMRHRINNAEKGRRHQERTSEEVFKVTLYKQRRPGDLKEKMKLFPLSQMSFPRFQIRLIIIKFSSNQNVKFE